MMCPRCQTVSTFVPKSEPGEEGKINIFIKCRRCGWRDEIRESTVHEERIRRDTERLKKKIAAAPPSQQIQLVEVLRRRLDRLR